MKISQYILFLNKVRKQFGDLKVYAEDEEYGKWTDVDDATSIKRPNEYFIQQYKNDLKTINSPAYKEAEAEPYAVVINGR
jgi:hypothetical protein